MKKPKFNRNFFLFFMLFISTLRIQNFIPTNNSKAYCSLDKEVKIFFLIYLIKDRKNIKI